MMYLEGMLKEVHNVCLHLNTWQLECILTEKPCLNFTQSSTMIYIQIDVDNTCDD